MDNTAVVFLPIFINRITELVKRVFVSKTGWSDEAQGGVILFLSFVMGILGVVFLFPATNLVPNSGAASPLAAQIVTGIIIAGFANGIDFLAAIGTTALGNMLPTVSTSSSVTVESSSTIPVPSPEVKAPQPPAVS